MPYLNLDVNYFDHIKTVRLIGLLGRGAAELPIRLWAYCGKHRAKDGDLAGYSAQEIESILGWWGKTGECVEGLIRVGLLERTSEGYRVHEWDEHEGHLVSFHERAKLGAKARWNASSNASSNAKDETKQCPNQPTNQPSLPNPPKDKTRARFVKPEKSEVEAYASTIDFKINGEEFVDYYESKGWCIGRAPMRDWKAAVRTWKKRNGEYGARTNASVVRLATNDSSRRNSYPD